MSAPKTARPEFITAPVVASLIGFNNAGTFLQARARMEQDQGFPPPMPTSRKPLKWRRSAIEAWVEDITQSPTPTPPGGNVVALRGTRA